MDSIDKDLESLYQFASITITTSIAYLILHYIFNVSKPKIHTSNQILRKFLDDHIPTLKNKYWPPWFAWGGRLQSGIQHNLRPHPNEMLPYTREVLSLKDGGQLALDFLGEIEINKNEDRLLVLILPGLTSWSNESYVKTMALAIVKTGSVVAVLNNRGLGGVPLTTPRTYCVTNSEDVQEVISHLKQKYTGVRILAIGASLGGMTLSRFLIDYPEQARKAFVAAMLISICWDPIVANKNLELPIINKYVVNSILTNNLKSTARINRSMLETRNCWDLNTVLTATTIREFDDYFTAPQFGFPSSKEYYKASQISPDIHKFSIPVFGLNAADDPMQPGEHLPIKEADAPGTMLALIVTERGGHLGFLEGALPIRRKVHYMEKVIEEFVRAIKLYSDQLSTFDNNNCDSYVNKNKQD